MKTIIAVCCAWILLSGVFFVFDARADDAPFTKCQIENAAKANNKADIEKALKRKGKLIHQYAANSGTNPISEYGYFDKWGGTVIVYYIFGDQVHDSAMHVSEPIYECSHYD